MLEAQTVSISIGRSFEEVYEAIWRPETFPTWASGLSRSTMEQQGDRWRAEGPEGAVTIRFTDRNPFGVMDHHVELGGGDEIYMPMRVIPNGDGAEVLLTVFRQPDMSDEKFRTDIEWVKSDLQALKAMLGG